MIRGSLLLFTVACSAPAEPAPRSPGNDTAAETYTVAETPAARVQPVASPPREEPNSPEPPAPDEPAGFVALPVPGFLEAVLFLPAGKDRSLVIATHGAGGEPEWTCAAWAKRTRGESMVLCPRGRAISKHAHQGYYYPDHHALEAEVLAALRALEAALGARAPKGPILYTGYSQGATMGALFLTAHAARFPWLILTEGGFEGWTRARAEAYAKNGGERVLFVCGGRGCEARAEKGRALLERAGVTARVDHVEGGGHTDGGRVGQHLDRVYRWVLEPESK